MHRQHLAESRYCVHALCLLAMTSMRAACPLLALTGLSGLMLLLLLIPPHTFSLCQKLWERSRASLQRRLCCVEAHGGIRVWEEGRRWGMSRCRACCCPSLGQAPLPPEMPLTSPQITELSPNATELLSQYIRIIPNNLCIPPQSLQILLKYL